MESWRVMKKFPLNIVKEGDEEKAWGGSIHKEKDAEYAHPIAIVSFHKDAPPQWDHRPNDLERAKNVAVLMAGAPDLLHALEGLLEISNCECDNTHKQNNTVCRVCWAQAVVDRIKKEK